MLEELSTINSKNINVADLLDNVRMVQKPVHENMDLSNETNSDLEDNTIQKESDANKTLMNLLEHFVKFNMSFTQLCATAKLINQTPGSSVIIPDTKYKIMKIFKERYDFAWYIYCKQCKQYIHTLYEKEICSTCGSHLTKNAFVYINLENQLKSLILRNSKSIFSFISAFTKNDSTVNDVHDGIVLKKFADKNIISLLVSSDGIAFQRSNTKSCWLIQVIII